MAFEIIKNDEIIFLLVLVGIPLIATTNVDCGGKSFHCVNSTHFMICVDLGGGVSTTVDSYVIPCPSPTVCKGTNQFECEFPVSTTLTPMVQPIVTTNEIEPTTLDWEQIYTTDFTNTDVEQHIELRTVSNIQENITDGSVTPPNYVIGNDTGGLLNVPQPSEIVLINTTDLKGGYVDEVIKASEPSILLTTEDIISNAEANKTESSTVFTTESTTINVTEPTIEILYGQTTDNVTPSDINGTELVTTIYNVIAPMTSQESVVPDTNKATTDAGSEKTTQVTFTDVLYNGETTTDETKSPMMDVNTEYVTQPFNETVSPGDSVNLTITVADNVTKSSIAETTDVKVGEQHNFNNTSINNVTDSVVINVTKNPDNNIKDVSQLLITSQDNITDKDPVGKGNNNNQNISELDIANITELSTVSIIGDIVSETESTFENFTEGLLVINPIIKENKEINNTVSEVSSTKQPYEDTINIHTTKFIAYDTTEPVNILTIAAKNSNKVLDHTSERIPETISVDGITSATDSFIGSALETYVTSVPVFEKSANITENYDITISTVLLMSNNDSSNDTVQIPTQVTIDSSNINTSTDSVDVGINIANTDFGMEISSTTVNIENVNPKTPDSLGVLITEKNNLLEIKNQNIKTTVDDQISYITAKSTAVYNLNTESIIFESTTVNNNVQVNSEIHTQDLWNNISTVEDNKNHTIVSNKSQDTATDKDFINSSNSATDKLKEVVSRDNNVDITIETTQAPQIIVTTLISANQNPFIVADKSHTENNGNQGKIFSDNHINNKFETESTQGVFDTTTSIKFEDFGTEKEMNPELNTNAVTEIIGYNTNLIPININSEVPIDTIVTAHAPSITEANIKEPDLNINTSSININGTEIPMNAITKHTNEEVTTEVNFGLDATDISYGETPAYDKTTLLLFQAETDGTTPSTSVHKTETDLVKSTQLNPPVNEVLAPAMNLNQNYTKSDNDIIVESVTYSSLLLPDTIREQEIANQPYSKSSILDTKTHSIIDVTLQSMSSLPSTDPPERSTDLRAINQENLSKFETIVSSSTPISISSQQNFADNVTDLGKNNTIIGTNGLVDTLKKLITESYHKATENPTTNSVAMENVSSGMNESTVTGNFPTTNSVALENVASGRQETTVTGTYPTTNSVALENVANGGQETTVTGTYPTTNSVTFEYVANGGQETIVTGTYPTTNSVALENVANGGQETTVTGTYPTTNSVALENVSSGMNESTVTGNYPTTNSATLKNVSSGLQKTTVPGNYSTKKSVAFENVSSGMKKTTVTRNFPTTNSVALANISSGRQETTVTGIYRTTNSVALENVASGRQETNVTGTYGTTNSVTLGNVASGRQETTVSGTYPTTNFVTLENVASGRQETTVTANYPTTNSVALENVSSSMNESTVTGNYTTTNSVALENVSSGMNESTVTGNYPTTNSVVLENVSSGMNESTVTGNYTTTNSVALENISNGKQKTAGTGNYPTTNSIVLENLSSGMQETTVTRNYETIITQSIPSVTEHISMGQTNLLENVLFNETKSNSKFIMTTQSYLNENVSSKSTILNISSSKNTHLKQVNVPNDTKTTPLNKYRIATETTPMALDLPDNPEYSTQFTDFKNISDETVSTLQISNSSHTSDFPRNTNKEILDHTKDGILLSTFSTVRPIKSNSTEFLDQANIVATAKNVAMNNENINLNTKMDSITGIKNKTTLTSKAKNNSKNMNEAGTTQMFVSTVAQNSDPKKMDGRTSISGTFLPESDIKQTTQTTVFIPSTQTTTQNNHAIVFSEVTTELVITTASNKYVPSTITERVTTLETIKQEAASFDCQAHPRGRYSDKHDCRKFYMCNGTPQTIVGLCPSNTVFSDFKKLCTKNLSHCIRGNQFHCVSQGRFSDFREANVYYICVKRGDLFLRYKLQCQTGFRLNRTTIRCYQNKESSSVSVSNDNNSQSATGKKKVKGKNKKDEFECKKEGKFPHSNDCRKYYVCSKTDESEELNISVKKCDSDEVFHKKKRRCVEVEDS